MPLLLGSYCPWLHFFQRDPLQLKPLGPIRVCKQPSRRACHLLSCQDHSPRSAEWALHRQRTTVEPLFHLYDEHACLAKVGTRALEQRLVGKKRNHQPTSKLSRGAIPMLLTNPIYICQIVTKIKSLNDGMKPLLVKTYGKVSNPNCRKKVPRSAAM